MSDVLKEYPVVKMGGCIPSVKISNPVLKGDDGGFYIPTVSMDGELSWEASEAGMPSVPVSNIQGPQGIPGKDGAPGKDGVDGEQGKQGERGPAGPAGKDGLNGKDGAEGKPGPIGPQGPAGKDGKDGKISFGDLTDEEKKQLKGDKGDKGDIGPAGPVGPVGPQGPIGPAGQNGKDGVNGADGKPGKDGYTPIKGVDYFDGKDGKDGLPGKDGKDGLPGEKGADGAPGKQGPQGLPGEKGKDGLPGPKGDKGEPGEQGPIGLTGPAGPQGEPGLPGKDGENGKDGAPGADGKPGKDGAEGKQGPMGPAGADGAPGQPGKDGTNGKDATINGVNTLTITQGDNITLSQDGEVLTISASGGGSAVDVPIATTETAGKVKPDGTTITVDEDGTIHGASGGGGGGTDFTNIITPCKAPGSIVVGTNTSASQNKYGQDFIIIGDLTNNGAYYDKVLSVGTSMQFYNPNGTVSRSIIVGMQHSATVDMSSSLIVGNSIRSHGERNCAIFGNSNDVNPSKKTYQIENSLMTGKNNIVGSNNQFVCGKKNIEDSDNIYISIAGNGSGTRSNAYTLDWQGNGSFAGKVASTGADYAEYFEWKDGNPEAEDRVGYIVALDGDKIVKANSEDILGIVSGTVGVLGDNYEWNWQGKYLTDDFGRTIYDMVEEFSEDPETHEKHSIGFFPHPRLNPEYIETMAYVNRANRPEWDAVGMMGKLYVRDDGTCEVNSYATAVNGIATKSAGKTNMRVMERVKPNIIRVCLK